MDYPVLFFLISPPCSALESVAQFKIDFNVSSWKSCLKETVADKDISDYDFPEGKAVL